MKNDPTWRTWIARFGREAAPGRPKLVATCTVTIPKRTVLITGRSEKTESIAFLSLKRKKKKANQRHDNICGLHGFHT